MQPRVAGALFAVHGRVVLGSVSYNGSFQFDSTQAAHGSSAYLGTSFGAEARYRWPGTLDGVAGLDLDWWKRQFSRSQRERYRIVSARFGVERLATASSPFVAGGGMRLLLATTEDASITDAGVTYDLSLSPGLGTNPFLHVGLRASPRVTLLAFWDGMRLGRSNRIVLLKRGEPQAIVSQPPTDMDVIGVRAVYGF
jgi:hypothetical protein